MGGCRCSYKTCTNQTNPGKMIHFFHYPVKTTGICLQWIKNADKPQFAKLGEEQLRNKVICEYHFEDKWFPNSQKKRLLKGAIPTLDGDALQVNVKTYKPSHTLPSLVPRDNTANISLLSTNEDQTIFVLDTGTVDFPISSCPQNDNIETYTYRNGALIPTNPVENRECEPRIMQEPFPKQEPLVDSHVYQDAENESHHLTVVSPESLYRNSNYMLLYSENRTEAENKNVANTSLSQNHKEPVTRKPRKRTLSKTLIHKAPDLEKKNTISVPKASEIPNEYIQKINDNSKDIAAIKKVLRNCSCLRHSPVNKHAALNAIKRFVPPTLFSIIKTCVVQKQSSQDMDFFKTIHDKSPDLYYSLANEHKWKLPRFSVVNQFCTK